MKSPLRTVVFNVPTSIPGTTIMMTTVTAHEERLVAGEPYICPQPFVDLDTEKVIIGDREYPMSRVHYYERAPAAKSKMPVINPAHYSRYGVGKREAEPQRLAIPVEDRLELPPKRGPKD